MARFNIQHSFLVMDAHDFSHTSGLSSALMPNPDIVLVRHFQVGDYPTYPYAGLRSLSGTNKTAFVTFYFESELNRFKDHLATAFEPDSVPTYTTDQVVNTDKTQEFIVTLTDFPEHSFVYKTSTIHR